MLMEVGLRLSGMKYEDEASVVNIDPSKLSLNDLFKSTQSCLLHFIMFVLASEDWDLIPDECPVALSLVWFVLMQVGHEFGISNANVNTRCSGCANVMGFRATDCTAVVTAAPVGCAGLHDNRSAGLHDNRRAAQTPLTAAPTYKLKQQTRDTNYLSI